MAEKQDIKMNQFQVVTDAPYIYVELADGSQGKIKKSDLVEVIRVAMPVATQASKGLMSNKGFFKEIQSKILLITIILLVLVLIPIQLI